MTVTTTVAADDAREPSDEARTPESRSGYGRTPEGAAAAAAAYMAALGGPAILDPAAIRRTVSAIASDRSRGALVASYESAAAHVRDQLGLGTASGADVILRASSVGYRVDGFHGRAAAVSIWRVGIVGGGAIVEPRQTWRTETVALVWERGGWRVDAVRSAPGPTPPLAGAVNASTALGPSIASFEEFTRELP